jgi:hypothetical protein
MKAELPRRGRHGIPKSLSRTWGVCVRFLFERTILALGLLFFGGMGVLLWHQASLQQALIESTVLQNSERYMEALTELRTLYTADVV